MFLEFQCSDADIKFIKRLAQHLLILTMVWAILAQILRFSIKALTEHFIFL